MTLRNRVTPFGQIVATPEHGTLMGNRGRLHDTQKRIVRLKEKDAWITCQLSWNGIHRTIMAPDSYTELFFLDEATALAAGHRPCNDCRSERLDAFKRAWAAGVEGRPGNSTLVSRIDPVLKADRWERKGVQRTYQARLGDLPDGVMVQLAGEPDTARLKWRERLLKWTPGGYEDPQVANGGEAVSVLTPACTVKVIAAGYPVEVHATAG